MNGLRKELRNAVAGVDVEVGLDNLVETATRTEKRFGVFNPSSSKKKSKKKKKKDKKKKRSSNGSSEDDSNSGSDLDTDTNTVQSLSNLNWFICNQEAMILTLETPKAEGERIDSLEREVAQLQSRVDEVLKEKKLLQKELARVCADVRNRIVEMADTTQEFQIWVDGLKEATKKQFHEVEDKISHLIADNNFLINRLIPLIELEKAKLDGQGVTGVLILLGKGAMGDQNERRADFARFALKGDAEMPRQKTTRQWYRAPYEADELSTNEKSHIPDEVLTQIPAHIFIAKFRDEEGDNIKTTIMPREIWTLHRRPEVASAVRAVHLEQFFRLPPWGTDYMRAHELMSSIQHDGKAMLTDSDGAKVEVLITKKIINEALQFIQGAYDLIPKTKAIDNEKAFLKVKGSKFKYSYLIYSELELPLKLISQHLRIQKPPRSTKSKKSSSEEERTETDKEQDCQESAQEEVPKEAEASVPSEYESDEEDTSVPLERKSQKPRSREQDLMDEAMARVKARRKELADARLQEEAEAAKAAQTQETEVVDLSGTIEYLKKLEREKHTAEQRVAQLAREKIKEALSRKAEEPVLELTQGSPKRPRQEEEEEIEDIQADPIPPSPISIPPAPPSSPITPFPLASTPQTPPSPSPLDIPESPPAPTSPKQQHLSAEPSEIPASLTEETPQPMETQESQQKETAQHMEKIEETRQTDGEQQQPAKVDVPILIVQEEEPSNEEAIEEVKSFDYTKLIQTLSRQFQCQQVVAKETKIQKTRTNQAQEEITNLRTALELVTKDQDSNAKENENFMRDLMDLQSQLTRKEAQNHELIKNENKMKEQLKYEDARFQKLNVSYNTVKNTLTALLQNQEPAAAAPSTSDSAALNMLAALQKELETEKLQRQLLVSGFMSQTAQHEARVKQLEEELAKAKAELVAVGSLASTSHIHQAETHVPI
ncbi:hypothetical protein L7F22_027716 [Adiantum nelumboides]|nr:hypothetical protein [Adiantum nelumboides]